jgi:hypothetical protein
MLGKIAYTWDLMRASWNILKADKTLLVFPLLSGICCIIVAASFFLPLFLTIGVQLPSGHAELVQKIAYYGLLFLFYFSSYFVITFFNAATISCAVLRMAGGEPTVADGFREAFARIHLIIGWALVSATIGLLLRVIEERSKLAGKIIASVLGAAWTVMSFLVVPILVVERKGPFAAMKGSLQLLDKTWGQQLAGNFSFGLIFALLGVPAWALFALGFFSGNVTALALCIAAGTLYLIILALVQSALQSIFQAAVYLHAKIPGGATAFPTELLESAMAPR